jgi:large subunit ribosomal protein L21
MAKLAIIKTGGKQYKVKEGQTLKIEKLNSEAGSSVKFDTLLISDIEGNELNIGKPSLGDKVEGKVINQGKLKKVTGVKYKNKVRYTRTLGHRQLFTKVEISKIG